jgi:hypothetical protein
VGQGCGVSLEPSGFYLCVSQRELRELECEFEELELLLFMKYMLKCCLLSAAVVHKLCVSSGSSKFRGDRQTCVIFVVSAHHEKYTRLPVTTKLAAAAAATAPTCMHAMGIDGKKMQNCDSDPDTTIQIQTRR